MKKIWIILFFCILFSVPVQAENTTDQLLQEQYENSGLNQVLDSLDSDSASLLERWGITEDNLFSSDGFHVSSIWQVIQELLADAVKNPLTACGSVAGIILICALIGAISPGENNEMRRATEYFGAVCMGAVLMTPAGYLLSKTASSIAAVGTFMLTFIPVYAGILIHAGRSLTAGGAGTLVFGCSQVILYASQNLLLPIIGMFMALSLCQAVSGGLKIDGFVAILKKTAIWILGLATTVYSAILTITGVINGAGDSLAQRTTRFFIGNMIPVVGGTLSETVGTVQSCLSLLKTGSGVAGLCVVFALLLPILIEILLWRLGLMLVTALSELMETDTLTHLLKALGEGIGIMLSAVICCLVVYMISLGVMALAGGGG